IQNTGDPAKDLWVNDTVPAGLTYLSDTANDLASAFRGRVVSGNSLYIRLGDMPSLQTWSFTVTANAATNLVPGSTLVNVASVDPGVADHWPMTINGSVTYTDAYRNVFPKIPVASNLIEASVPRIVLRVAPATTSIEADALVFYNIYLVNAGSGVAGGVQLSLPLPASFLYITDTSDATLTTVSSTYTWSWT